MSKEVNYINCSKTERAKMFRTIFSALLILSLISVPCLASDLSPRSIDIRLADDSSSKSIDLILVQAYSYDAMDEGRWAYSRAKKAICNYDGLTNPKSRERCRVTACAHLKMAKKFYLISIEYFTQCTFPKSKEGCIERINYANRMLNEIESEQTRLRCN